MGEILDNGPASIEQDGKVADVTASIYDGTDAGFGEFRGAGELT